MTEKDVYKNGVALLEEWEDVNYCEHSFKFKDEWLTDKEVVDLLNELHGTNEQLRHDAIILIHSNQDYRKENEQLKQQLRYLEYRFTEYRIKVDGKE